MKKKWLVMSTGFALFSMFFGSGNLVFPITVGKESAGHYAFSALGIILTGVVVPFLGVFGMMLYKGSLQNFFSFFGKKGTFLFSFLALALMGPFGVLARCLTVAHGALMLVFPGLSLPVTSALLCLTIYLLVVNKNRVLTILGMVLTPFLLLSIAAIAFFGLNLGAPPLAADVNGFLAFKNGFFQGYQTMDLLAAFFFSQFVINQLYSEKCEPSPLTVFAKSALIGAGILSAVYFVLVLLGWIYSPLLTETAPQEMLGAIAMASLGSWAAPSVCIAVVFACLTTAMVLTSLFAEFLRCDVSQGKLGNTAALMITLAIGFSVSTLEFAGIARILGPILEAVYPALIALTVVNVLRAPFRTKTKNYLYLNQKFDNFGLENDQNMSVFGLENDQKSTDLPLENNHV